MKLMLRVNTDTLRVRSAPDTDSEILGRIHEGETYDFLSRAGGGWIKIRYGEKDGYATCRATRWWLIPFRRRKKWRIPFASRW